MRIQHLTRFVTRFFPLMVILVAVLAFFYPQPVLELGLRAIVPWLLAFIMLGMGLTLSFRDFSFVMEMPKKIIIGVFLRSLIMPLVAFALVHIFQLPQALALGLVLVGCCPSGTASNVMTFLAGGDVALSVTLTTIITLLAPILTPITFYWLMGVSLEFNPFAMVQDIFLIVVVPVILGMVLHWQVKSFIVKIQSIFPLLSICAIVLIIAIVVALNGNYLTIGSSMIFLVVILHNLSGLFFGFWGARLFGLSPTQSKAISFETGMENSGLAVTLALAHFSDPIVAIPGVVFSIWHNISGSALASYWRKCKTIEIK